VHGLHCGFSGAVWLITEQVALAAMDTGALELAVELVKDVKKKFPSSQRAIRLTVRPRHLHALGIFRSILVPFPLMI